MKENVNEMNHTYFDVRLDALMLKNRAFASDATALACNEMKSGDAKEFH